MSKTSQNKNEQNEQTTQRVNLTLDVNTRFINKVQRKDMYAFNMSFSAVSGWTIRDLAIHIWRGHSWTSPFVKEIPDGRKTYRNKCNVTSVQAIALDDDVCGFDRWVNDWCFLRYGAMLHTTSSHTPTQPRTRVVFVLESPVSPDLAERLVKALHYEYPHVDESATDASRVFYGAKGCTVHLNNRVMPLSHVDRTIFRHEHILEMEREAEIYARQKELERNKLTRCVSSSDSDSTSLDDYVVNAVNAVLATVKTTYVGVGKSHNAVINAAMRLSSLAKADWHGVNLDDWGDRLLSAATESGYFNKYYRGNGSESRFKREICESADSKSTPATRPHTSKQAHITIGQLVTLRHPKREKAIYGTVEHFKNDGGTKYIKVNSVYYPASWLGGGA